ncbi:MAG: mnhE [Rickettsiaceae bacterium]|jgi:multicomponent Na+:H+ antiporter subunit E|nr:mnhE [Rickettsiaceae bacterium]
MKAKLTLFISLLFFTIILFGIEKFIHEPILTVSVCMVSFLISIKIITISNLSLKLIKSYRYFIWLVKEIFWSSINVATIAWQPTMELKPAYKWIESKQKKELGLVLYANSITLTPGTVTIETNENNLLIHALDNSSIQDLQAGIMDKKILEIVS